MPKGVYKHLPVPDEIRKKISISNLGKPKSLEHRKNIANAQKFISLETRKKRSDSLKALYRSGKHPMWKGGISSVNELIRKSFEYKLWRKAVFERDNYTCIWCGRKDKTIKADHIKRFADYPELRFAIDNGRTLCDKCHKTTDTYGVNIKK